MRSEDESESAGVRGVHPDNSRMLSKAKTGLAWIVFTSAAPS